MLARISGILGPFPPEMLMRGRHAHKYFVEGVVYEQDRSGKNHLLQPRITSLRKRLHTDDELFLSFVGSLLRINPKDRPTAKQALEHPWITNRATLSDAPLSEEVANSLKKYADAHRFEKAIRYQMATHMTSAELHRLRNVFERLDTDGTGHVSIGALMETLKKDAADAKTAETLGKIDLANFDLDGDGQIDWQEFVAGAMTEHHYHNGDISRRSSKTLMSMAMAPCARMRSLRR